MRLVVIPRIGREPISLEASQIVVYNDEGTPIMVAGEFGMAGAHKVSHAADDDFQQTLRAFGVDRHQVIVEQISSAPIPGGATLLKKPE